MGRTLESKQQIVEELKKLLGEAEMALVLDYQGLSIKEMSDLRTRLQASNGVCKVTKNTLMRRAIDGDSVWSSLDSLLSGTNAFILVKGDVGGACKALQASVSGRDQSYWGASFQGRAHGPDRRRHQRSYHQGCCGCQRGSIRSCKSAQAARR